MSLATSCPAVSADHDLADETLAKRVRLFLETLRLAVLRRSDSGVERERFR
jgi:hypothetical protein